MSENNQPEVELKKVIHSIQKSELQRKLATAKLDRLLVKRSAPGFAGFTGEQQQEMNGYEDEIKKLNSSIPQLYSLKEAIEKAIANNETVFLYEDIGGLDADGNFIITNEDQYLDMMYGDELDDTVADNAGDKFFIDKDENQAAAHKEMGEFLKSLGIDPSKIGSSASLSAGPSGPAPHQHDEFAIFRSAKMGNIISFRNEEVVENSDLRTCKDNNERTSLHYAADSGNEVLVKYLLTKGLNPLEKDASNPPMTPLDIAVLLHRTAAVKTIEEHLKEQGITLTPEMKDAKALQAKFAPVPPRFLMSKGAPAFTRRGTPQVFWGTASPETLPACCEVPFYSPEFMKQECIDFFNQPENSYPRSMYSWLNPVTLKLFRTAPQNSFCVQTPQCNVYSLVFALGGCEVMTKGDNSKLHACGTRPALVNHTTLHTDFRKTDDAKIIFDLTRNALLKNNFDTAIFLSNAYGPSLVAQDTCRIKWFQKVLNPINILDHTTPNIVDEVYPDFYALAPVIRADLYRKAMFASGGVKLEREWVDIKEEGLEDEYAQGICTLLQDNLKFISSCYINLNTPQAVKDVLIGPNVVFCSGPSPKDVRNVVILSHRHSKTTTADGVPVASAAVCVFSHFGNMQGESKLNEMAKLATQKMGAEVLYVTNTHGTSTDDLRKAVFDECPNYGTNLYMINANFRSVSGKIDPAKIHLPFAML